MDASFVTTTGLPGALSTGVVYFYSSASGEPTNPVTENLTADRLWVHPLDRDAAHSCVRTGSRTFA